MGQRSRRAAVGAGSVAVLLAALVGCSSSGDSEKTGSGPGDSGAPTSAATSASGPQGTVWVADEGSGAMTAINAATNDVVTTVSGISGPHNVQVAPDGKHVYAISGDGNTVVEVDTADYRLTASGPTGNHPAHVVLTPDGKKTYVTNNGDGTISVYQAGDLKPTKVIRIGGAPHGTRPTADGSALVVANMGAKTVDVVDTKTDTKTASVPVGGPPVQVAVSPDGKYAYASISEPAGVVKVDLRTNKVTARTPVPASPAQVYLTPDGRTLLSADQGTEDKPGRTVSLIDTAKMTSAGSVTTGSGPHGLVVEPNGKRAWVTNMYDGTVSLLDLTARKAVATVKVGDEPNGISFAARTPAEAEPSLKLEIPSASTSPSDTGGHHDTPGMDHDMPGMDHDMPGM